MYLLEKPDKQTGIGLRGFNRGQVACPLDDVHSGLGNEFHRRLDKISGARSIKGSCNAKSGLGDAVEIGRKVRVGNRCATAAISIGRHAREHVMPGLHIVSPEESRREPAFQNVGRDALKTIGPDAVDPIQPQHLAAHLGGGVGKHQRLDEVQVA